MTALPTLARSPIFEQIPKHGTLFMSGYGLRLQVQHGHLCAEWGVGRDRHKLRLSRVNRDLKRVIVMGSGGFATFDAIRWVADIGHRWSSLMDGENFYSHRRPPLRAMCGCDGHNASPSKMALL